MGSCRVLLVRGGQLVIGGFDLGGSAVVEFAVEAFFVEPAHPAAGGDLEVVEAPPRSAVAAALNGRPRKTLNWRTPAEALEDLLRSAQEGGVASTP